MSSADSARTPTSRRAFLRAGAVMAATAPTLLSGLAACEPSKGAEPAKKGTAAAATPPAPRSVREMADDMDAMHEQVIKSFPAKTRGRGNVVMPPRLERGVKVFELACREIDWEVKPGQTMKAWAYNDQVPGPQIRVREGDRVRIRLTNQLPESTAIHFHGLEVPNDQDGVPFITQQPIKPGESYTYEFTVPNAGSHMYHSHHNAAMQVGLGLLGAFVVEPRDRSWEPKVDLDYVMILNDVAQGFTLNGKSFPATEPVVCRQGQTIRVRFMNEGMMIHPMHLHGMHMTVIAKDGWYQPAPFKCDTLNIAPGERWDVLIKASNPGTWAFHCHILTHAESSSGMFGMVTALIVKPTGVA